MNLFQDRNLNGRAIHLKCQFLSQLKQDTKTICSSDNIYVPADNLVTTTN